MKFPKKKERSGGHSSDVNLRGNSDDEEAGRTDDDTVATRMSRTIDFEDEPDPEPSVVAMEEVSVRNARSFLDPVHFDDETPPHRRMGGLAVEELAELTDSQRDSRSAFLNDTSLMGGGRPNLAGIGEEPAVDLLNPTQQETKGLIQDGVGATNYALHENLMSEEGIPVGFLDAKERYQDGLIQDATKNSLRRTRCRRYVKKSILMVLVLAVIAGLAVLAKSRITSKFVTDNDNSQLSNSPIEQIETPSMPQSEFWQEIKIDANLPDFEDDDDNVRFRPPVTGKLESQIEFHDEYCHDNPGFLHNGERGQDCTWVADFDTVARCTRLGVTENCRLTCDPDCSAPTAYPTENPTEVPTLDPTYDIISEDEDEDEDGDIEYIDNREGNADDDWNLYHQHFVGGLDNKGRIDEDNDKNNDFQPAEAPTETRFPTEFPTEFPTSPIPTDAPSGFTFDKRPPN